MISFLDFSAEGKAVLLHLVGRGEFLFERPNPLLPALSSISFRIRLKLEKMELDLVCIKSPMSIGITYTIMNTDVTHPPNKNMLARLQIQF